MNGRSLMGILTSEKSGRVEKERDAVFTGRERHAWCRLDGLGYPARMIRTHDYLYIRNYEPERLPAGDYRVVSNEGNHGDVDASPSKGFMLSNKEKFPKQYEAAFGKRPMEELYDCKKDPHQINNLASDPEHAKILKELSQRLTDHLKATSDPRETTGEAPWDTYKYYGKSNWPILPED